jgi:hypothetical protein
MDKKEIIKILKLLKKDKKKKRKATRGPKAQELHEKVKGPKKPYVNISNLVPSTLTQVKYQPDFQIPNFKDTNRIELEQFAEYKKSRGFLPSEKRGIIPSEYELQKEFDKVKKLSKGEVQDLLTNTNIKSQALERQKYLDKLQIDEEKRLIKEQKALVTQQLKTKKRLEGIRAPPVVNNLITSKINAYSNSDSNGLESAIGGSSDDFITQESEAPSQVEAPSVISVAGSGAKPKRKYVRKVITL